MKTLILASAIGLSTLMLAGCVSEGPSYQGDGYTMRPRDTFDRDDRYDRARDRTDYSRYSRDRDPGRRDRNDDDRRTDRRDDRRGDDRRCSNDPRCEVPEYNPDRPGYYRRG
jgi:hypothetical protein